MKIQNIYKCKHFTDNENMNRTCRNKKMCKVYYDEICEDFKIGKNKRTDC